MKRFYIILIITFLSISTQAQFEHYLRNQDAPFNYINTHWADSIFKTMSEEERIGQLFMVATYATEDKRNNYTDINFLISKYHIGGLLFMQGSPKKQIQLLNEYQQKSKTPLLVGMDLERGLGFRLKNTSSFPHNMTLGAISNDMLLYQLAREIGKQMQSVGVHVNFAPVLDINNNPKNPIIGTRSFGEDRNNVAKKAYAFVRGLQDMNIIAVGKHFPGHGDTQVDSHHALPTIFFTRHRLDSLELYPFSLLNRYGIGGIMTAHLEVPLFDNKPASISHKITTELLQDEMGFRGLVFTDALNMRGVGDSKIAGEIELKALLAGNDILLFPRDVPNAVKRIKKAIERKLISQEDIDRHVKKILRAKQWVGLNHWKPLSTENLDKVLHSTTTEVLQENLAKSAITLLQNRDKLLPLKRLDTLKIATVALDESSKNTFQNRLSHYTQTAHFNIPKGTSVADYSKIIKQLEDFNTIIISKHRNSYNAKSNFGVSKATIDFIQNLPKNKRILFAYFGSPYGVAKYNLNIFDAIIVGYEDTKYTQEAVAQAIFGGIAMNGKLPLAVNKRFPANWGLTTPKVRLGYSTPDASGMYADSLAIADSIMLDAIKKKATPGGQILIAKNGNIVYNKAFGHHTFKEKIAVKTTDIYDLASITKVTATLPLLMQEYDEGIITLETTLGELLPYFENTDKENITLGDMLKHQSGLPSWIPLYRILLDTSSYKGKLISYRKNAQYTVQIDQRGWLNKNAKYKKGLFSEKGKIPVGKDMYLTSSQRDVLFDTIVKYKIKSPKKTQYLYSDLGFILSGEYLKAKGKMKHHLQTFYKQLGAITTTMQPWKYFQKNRIVPTAKENFLRKQLLHGYVHDPNAALLGGVAGHAGLFSSAEDLAKIWQMYLQKGSYGGERFIAKETIDLFSKQADAQISHRGIGFDKPDPDTTKTTSFMQGIPLEVYGHSGFTGTLVFVDPTNDLLFIFLSNRVYPNDWNTKLFELDVRPKIQDVVYKAIREKRPYIFPINIPLKENPTALPLF